ncbi:MAG TPA: hypothetical protein PKN21_01245, partial [Bacteroidales bacterium]|nr:hypothetical protein [Bacteroidales bacterium]
LYPLEQPAYIAGANAGYGTVIFKKLSARLCRAFLMHECKRGSSLHEIPYIFLLFRCWFPPLPLFFNLKYFGAKYHKSKFKALIDI